MADFAKERRDAVELAVASVLVAPTSPKNWVDAFHSVVGEHFLLLRIWSKKTRVLKKSLG
jgi:hypothetical protein